MSGSGRLRTRIVRSTAIVSGLAMAAMIGTVLLSLAAVTRHSVDSTLNDRFSVIAAGVGSSSQGPTVALETPNDAIDDGTWLYGADGVEIEGPRAGDRVQDFADSLSQVTVRTRVTRYERSFLAGPVAIGGRSPSTGVLIVSERLDPYADTRTETIIGLVLLGLLVTAGATAIAAWTVSRTLEPVESMAALAEDWSAQELDARFDDQPNDDEISHLGSTLNVLLDRVAGALRSEQRLTSELAHELRTPLTAIRGEAELAAMSTPDPDTRERLDRLVALTDRMSATITTLLDLARGDMPAGNRTTTLEAVVEGVLGHLPTPTPDLVVDEDLGGVGTTSIAATTDVGVRALSPLVDNAVRHATSRVHVSATVQERTVTITVSDDGPGLTGVDPEELFVAGVHRGEHSGAGLGLSLAKRAARSLGGDVTVTSHVSPTSFSLTLPRR